MLPPKDKMQQLKQEQEERFKEPEPTQVVDGFGPPAFDDNYDEDELQDAYRGFEEDKKEEYEPELERPIDDEDEYGFEPPPRWGGAEDYPEPPSFRQEGASFLKDDAIFEGGPSRTEVASWKKQFEQDGHYINLTEHADEVFIWRTLNRVEYREIMALPNTDPLQREEIICEICVLFPYEYNFTSMASRKAGVPAVLAEQIMQESGFKQPSPPIRL